MVVVITGITVTDKIVCHCIETSTMEKHKFRVDKSMHEIMRTLMVCATPLNLPL